MPFIQYKEKRILYIHIPKTGGTSVEEWLKTISPLRMFSVGIPHAVRCTPQHFRAQDIRALMGEDFFDLSITVVRNPYERIASEYRMRMHIEKQGLWKSAPNFSLWLEENLSRQSKDRFYLDNHLRPQWEFIGNNVEIFKLEDGLLAPLQRIAKVLGVKPPEFPPHELRSREHSFTWDIADKILVQTHYAKDFEVFDYRK